MVTDFAKGIIPDNSVPFLVQVEAFISTSPIIGLTFSVLRHSDPFRPAGRKDARK